MALGALKVAYGKKSLVASGPLLQKATRKGQHITLAFSDVGKGLKVDGERLQRLAVAGADKRFVWVDAVVKKDRIEIHADRIPEPRWVRYAWADNPAGANLYNSAGLPASPFEAYLD
jgi:sialate O-acetylesterase